eukprot:COSAG06_NODE_1098_length_10712_cov_8.529633_5_plen_156_part_00
MFNLFKKQTPLQCSVLLCSALQAMGGRLSAAHSFQSLQSQLAGALLGMSCACLRVFECKNAPFNPDKLGTVLTLLGRGDTQDPARTQRDLFRFCHNATYVRRARGNTRSPLSRRRAWRCVRKRFIPSVRYMYILHIYVEVPIKHSTTFCNYHSIL